MEALGHPIEYILEAVEQVEGMTVTTSGNSDRREQRGSGTDRMGAPSLGVPQQPRRATQSTETAAAGRTRRARYARKMIDKSSGAENPGKVTTMMLSNLPAKVLQLELIDMLDVSGFAAEFDFCYTPSDFHSGNNNGHAFINFRDRSTAVRFKEEWHGSAPFSGHADNRALRVVPAHIQGRKNNMKMAELRMNVRDPNFSRLVFTRDLAASPDHL